MYSNESSKLGKYSEQSFQNIHESRELILRKNRRTVHIFRDSNAKICMCSKTHRKDYGRNHVQVEASAREVLEADKPGDLGILGHNISTHGMNNLEKKVDHLIQERGSDE